MRLKLPNIPAFFSNELKGIVRSIYQKFDLIERQVEATQKAVEEVDYTPIDTTPPKPPTELTVLGYGSYNRLTWKKPVSTDLSHYEIVHSNTENFEDIEDSILIVPARNTQADHQNTDPEVDYYYFIRSVDKAENVSEWHPVENDTNYVLGSNVPPPDSISIPAGWFTPDANFTWPDVDHKYLKGYRIVIKNTNDVQRRVIPLVTGNNFSYTYSMNCDDWLTPAYEIKVQIHSVDQQNRISPHFVEATFTLAMPLPVSGLIANIEDLGFILKWTPSENPIVTGYDVALNDTVLITNQQGSNYLYETLLVVGNYAFKVRAVDMFGRTTEWAQELITVEGPQPPVAFRADVIDNTVLFFWSPPTEIHLPITEYDLRRGPTFDGNDVLKIGRKKGSFTTYMQTIPGKYKYWLAAVDSAGNIGEPAGVDVTIAEPVDYELNKEWVDDFKNGVSENVLVQPDGTAIAPYTLGETWEEHFQNNGCTSMNDFINKGYTYLPEPVPNTAFYEEGHDYGAVITLCSVTCTLDKEDFNGGPLTITWLSERKTPDDPWEEKQSNKCFATDFQYVKDRFEFTSDTHQFSYLKMHTLQLDSKLMTDNGKDEVVNAETGLTVLFNKKFIDVKSLVATAFSTIPVTVVVDFEDQPYPTKFIVYIFNKDGEKITGKFSWQAKGY